MTDSDNSIECVLFDLDGTLLDTAADFQRVLDCLMDDAGRPRVTPEQLHQTVSNGARALVELAWDMDDRHADFAHHHQRLLDLYYEQLDKPEAVLYPGMLELLDELETAGISWGVVTNKPDKYSRRLMQRLNLLDRCGTLVCPDHVKTRKPDPEAILLACSHLGVNTERTIYIGDHERDMQAAKNADIIAVAAAYGYLAADTRIEDWGADFVINSPADASHLLSILKFA